tara:strand:- start:2167 stop:3354 length:1188 start_codon:yes stop_codon:yes gene_type:complete
MTKRGPTGWDIANLGVDIYQTRKISQLRKEISESNEVIQMQMLEMQMAQQMESNKKQMMVEFRKLVLEIEEELLRIRRFFTKYPAHSAISFDLLSQMLAESPLSSEFFEEFHDIERTKVMEQNLAETRVWIESRMTSSIEDTKLNILKYTTEEPNLVAAIELALEREDFEMQRNQNQSNLINLNAKWEQSQPEWEMKKIKIRERKTKLSSTAKYSILSGAGLVILILSLSAVYLRIPESQLEDYVSYVFYASWIPPIFMWLQFSSSPILSKKDPLVILRNSISSCEIRLAELDQILSSPAPNFDGKKTSAELTQLKSEWLSFVDKNSPKSEEYAAASTPPSSAPKHLFEGPPRTPSVSLKGQIDENGREWIEYPPGSDRWHYRLMSRGEWMQWRD